MHRTLLVTLALLSVSCGPGQPTYLDRVRPLEDERTHPLVKEVIPLLERPQGRSPDELMRVWKEYLGTASLPLRQDNAFTFVYYDFSHTLERVFLEVSFAPGRREELRRLGTTALFFASYEVPKPDRLRYRFTDGSKALIDPFHPDVMPEPELWQRATEALDAEITLQRVLGASEERLDGQDVRLALPPRYRRNLAWTYPVVVVAGLESEAWTRPLAQLMEQGATRPLVAVSVGLKDGRPWKVAELKAFLEDRLVPWVRTRYRVSSLPSDMTLVGWGDSAKAVQEVAAGRPDFWSKTWIPPSTQAVGEEAWNSQAQAWLRAQFAVAKP